MSRQPPTMPPNLSPEPEMDRGEQQSGEEAISIQVDEAYLTRVDADDLARAVAATLAADAQPNGEVTVVVADDETVRGLNSQYRGIDEPTDVLSFPAQDPTPGFISAPGMAGYLGDIVIALPFTERQAAALRRALRDELRLLAIHGTLHLLGYDHAEPEEEARMWARQDAILASLEP